MIGRSDFNKDRVKICIRDQSLRQAASNDIPIPVAMFAYIAYESIPNYEPIPNGEIKKIYNISTEKLGKYFTYRHAYMVITVAEHMELSIQVDNIAVLLLTYSPRKILSATKERLSF